MLVGTYTTGRWVYIYSFIELWNKLFIHFSLISLNPQSSYTFLINDRLEAQAQKLKLKINIYLRNFIIIRVILQQLKAEHIRLLYG